MVKSEWKVQSNPINGEIWFIPYRIRDTSQPVATWSSSVSRRIKPSLRSGRPSATSRSKQKIGGNDK